MIELQNCENNWMFSLLANQDWAAQEQQLRIFKLQAERERLKRRQQEIAKLSVSLFTFSWRPPINPIFAIQIGEDPFLPGMTDHTRQESGDSGLNVSLSHTPDFLASNDDSMDGINTNVTDSMDIINFNDAMETPDDFMVKCAFNWWFCLLIASFHFSPAEHFFF